MGFRSSIKAGGGFLNNVDGEITGYEITTRPPGGDAKETSDWVWFVPTIKQDGAEEEITQHFFLGGADRYNISKDGQTLSVDEGNVTIGANTPTGKLLASILDSGFDESELPDLEDGEDLTLEALVGKRYRFIQEVDEEATKKLGKRKDKRTKKEYNRTNTVVCRVYGDATPAKDSKASKTSGKSNGSMKANGKAKHNDEEDLTEEADAVLVDVLEANDGKIERGRLSLVLTKTLMKNPNREALKKLIFSEDFLGREEGWSYDATSKKQVIEAA
jgi:hypothetical protein